MKTLRWFAFLIGVVLAGCGPILGQAMRVADGTKRFEFMNGSARDLQGGGPLLVFGPFDKTADAFYICRGEDAADFSDALREAGLFQTRLLLERDYEQVPAVKDKLRSLTPEEIRDQYQLPIAPKRILFGTITHRETIIAPTRGVVMIVAYRLEFYDPVSKQSTVLAVGVRDLAQNTIPRIVEELSVRLHPAE